MKRVLVVGVLSCTALLVLAGCVEKKKRLSKVEQEMAEQIVLTKAPAPQHVSDIRFGDRVRLLGYDVSTSRVQEGKPFTLTWYWAVDKPLGPGWKLFTHLADATKKSRINIDANRPLRRLYPESGWKAGDIIKDVQQVTLPEDWNSPELIIFTGFWSGSERLAVSGGASDGENRAEGARLSVTEAGFSPPLPRLIARRVDQPPKIDGKLDEPDWAAAQSSGPLVQTMTGAPGSFDVRVRVLYDARNLYLGYEVQDNYLKCTFAQHDDHLWEQDAVELMVDPEADGRNYFEIQVSPTGLVFDTRYDSRRKPQPFGDMGWDSQTTAKVALDGKPNDDDEDKGYVVEMAVPWSAFAAGPKPAAPPAAGETIAMNFFVMDAREHGQRAVGWSAPLIGDFHTLDRFGRVVFPLAADAGAAATGAPPAPARNPIKR